MSRGEARLVATWGGASRDADLVLQANKTVVIGRGPHVNSKKVSRQQLEVTTNDKLELFVKTLGQNSSQYKRVAGSAIELVPKDCSVQLFHSDTLWLVIDDFSFRVDLPPPPPPAAAAKAPQKRAIADDDGTDTDEPPVWTATIAPKKKQKKIKDDGSGVSGSDDDEYHPVATKDKPRAASRRSQSPSANVNKSRNSNYDSDGNFKFADKTKPPCAYDEKCYRKNPQHFLDEYHSPAVTKKLKDQFKQRGGSRSDARDDDRGKKNRRVDDDNHEDEVVTKRPVTTPPKPVTTPPKPVLTSPPNKSLYGRAPSQFDDDEEEKDVPLKRSTPMLRTDLRDPPKAVPAPAPEAPVAVRVTPSSSSSSSSAIPAKTHASVISSTAKLEVTPSVPSTSSSSKVSGPPIVLMPLLGVANGIPPQEAAQVAVQALKQLESGLPPGHNVHIYYVVSAAEKRALDNALLGETDLSGWVHVCQSSFLQVDELNTKATFVVLEVTWRFKSVNKDVSDALGPSFEGSNNGAAAQIGKVYPAPVPSGTILANEGIKQVLQLVVPNYNNNKKPDMLTDLAAAVAELHKSYQGLTAQLKTWASIATLPPSKGKEKATSEDDIMSGKSSSETNHTGGWSNALLNYIDHPEKHRSEIYDEDDTTITIYDKYPKAKVHLLVLPRKKILRLKDLTRDDLPLIDHMGARANIHARKLQTKNPGMEFNIGFHAVPSMQLVHLHVISQDFESPALKHKKHWNSFTTKFFLSFDDVRAKLDREGSIQVDEKKYEELLEGPLRCPRCHAEQANLPKAKEHLKSHFLKK